MAPIEDRLKTTVIVLSELLAEAIKLNNALSSKVNELQYYKDSKEIPF